MSPILSGRGLVKRFGNNLALRGVDFDIAPGEITGLIGANGAGKSTLLRIVAGATAPDAGELLIEGRAVRLTSVNDATRAGIALVSQELNLFPALSVFENLALGPGARASVLAGSHRAERSIVPVLRSLGLSAPLGTRVRDLSLGDRQLVEIARALLLEPRMLILDEPTSALRKPEKERLHRVMADLRDRGVGVVYVSHFLEDLLATSDRLVILRDGTRVGEGLEPRHCRVEDVVEAMLGRKSQSDGSAPARAGDAGSKRISAPGLRLTDLRGPDQLDVDDLEIPPGHVTGVAGLAGAGVEELFAVLFGRVMARAGDIRLPSGHAAPRSIADAVAKGVAFVPSDRKRLGLMLGRSIVDNSISVRALVQGRDGFVLGRRRLVAIARARCQALGVKMASFTQPVGHLSGGNQQKVVFAKWLETAPSLVLLDDPTRGVDVGAKRDMHRIIHELAARGTVVLMASSDPRELIEVADGIKVFVQGRITRTLSASEFNEHDLVAAMNSKFASDSDLKVR